MRHALKSILLLFLSSAWALAASGQSIPPKPRFQAPVYDNADMLNPQQESALAQKLLSYSDSTSTQIVILTLPAIGGDDTNLFATELAQKWGIGQKDKGNGILILVAKRDRKVAISTGYGIEYLLTDARSRQIIETDIAPQFKNKNFYTGLDLAVDAIFKVLKGEYKGDGKKSAGSGRSAFLTILFLFVLFIAIFSWLSRGGRGGDGTGGRKGLDGRDILLTGILLSGLGRGFGGGGFGGSSGLGGGFSGGFGGGGFGGGGASGSW